MSGEMDLDGLMNAMDKGFGRWQDRWEELGGRDLSVHEAADMFAICGGDAPDPLFDPRTIVNGFASFHDGRFLCMPDTQHIHVKTWDNGFEWITIHIPRRLNKLPGSHGMFLIPSRYHLAFYGGPIGRDFWWRHEILGAQLISWRPSISDTHRDKLEFRVGGPVEHGIRCRSKVSWLDKITLPREIDDCGDRSSMESPCSVCGKPLGNHSPDYRTLGYEGEPYLTRDCAGKSWKL